MAIDDNFVRLTRRKRQPPRSNLIQLRTVRELTGEEEKNGR